MYTEGDITRNIIGQAMRVHREVGPGFKETVYHRALTHALTEIGLYIDVEKRYDVSFAGSRVGTFIPDIVVEKKIIVELKSVSDMKKLFYAQIISYLRAAGMEVGLLINFGNQSLEFKRFANYKDYSKSISGIQIIQGNL
ncbi:MAG: GxxExxY protein [Candidatus Magasanikbacteria bacterium CG10_big_fil_rev_8_21_14_0_10_47_10]|uniref:GxxExxY protein n=1 Tax=Candidatus Magasanikbacteria bacterium CG10_big_fil_rev_8_21_14_0_10_47_10 TaxID=1974652 RepID=A0A2H0TR98_9BACT|nr:MAG: GxxExxY protein [Candidatus Magasanikbacteria bacterium CG10_big_fil_rev_8_21_14_0_10_47_10]